MKINNRINWTLAGLLLFAMVVMYGTKAHASEQERRAPPEVNINSGNTRTIDRSQDLSTSSESAAAAQAAANAAGGDGGGGGGGGSSNVTTENRSSSIVLTGAKDTADCFTKVGVGAEGFGIFWSRSDAFCKKVRLIAGQIDRGNLAAAARLECTLNEWQEVYGHSKPRNRDGSMTEGYQLCVEDLDMTGPEGVVLTHDEYHSLTIAQVSQDEYQEQTELVEYRMAQQTNLIESLQQETEADDLELTRLRALAAKLASEQDARKAADASQQNEFAALYEKRVAQEIEEPAQQEEPPNE